MRYPCSHPPTHFTDLILCYDFTYILLTLQLLKSSHVIGGFNIALFPLISFILLCHSLLETLPPPVFHLSKLFYLQSSITHLLKFSTLNPFLLSWPPQKKLNTQELNTRRVMKVEPTHQGEHVTLIFLVLSYLIQFLLPVPTI